MKVYINLASISVIIRGSNSYWKKSSYLNFSYLLMTNFVFYFISYSYCAIYLSILPEVSLNDSVPSIRLFIMFFRSFLPPIVSIYFSILVINCLFLLCYFYISFNNGSLNLSISFIIFFFNWSNNFSTLMINKETSPLLLLIRLIISEI